MGRRRPPLARRVAWVVSAGLLAASVLAACVGPGGTGWVDAPDTPGLRAPRYRAEGERLPRFCGHPPEERGWVCVDGLLWIESRDVDAYRRGQVFDGSRYVPLTCALPPGVVATGGFRLRTDHVTMQTNLAWCRAKIVAREAEAHAVRLVSAYGDILGLRLPADPLPVVVYATRLEFEGVLGGLVHDPVGWGAFYDSCSGVVHVSAEPAARGALPWQADLRHEMTHQILDLSRPPERRIPAIQPPWFWLWEGIAIWFEGLGDPPGADTGRDRIRRFQVRHARQETTPLATLLELPQSRYEGRHYDQTGSFMRFLLDDRCPARRDHVLSLVARMLAGTLTADLEGELGMRVPDLERAWLATVGR